MIAINGRGFALNKAEAAKAGADITGYYKPIKGGLVLMDMEREPQAFVYSNSYGCGRLDGAEI